MPKRIAPGVYVEETSVRAKPIEALDTRVAGIVGPTRFGPTQGPPVGVSSFAEFEAHFGDTADLIFGGASQTNHTALAARAFFENGGTKLQVVRVARGDDEATAPTPADYVGTTDDQRGSTGLAALEEVAEISIVLTPAAVALERDDHRSVVTAVQAHCERMRHRFGLIDPRKGATTDDLLAWRREFGSSRMALYCPWVRVVHKEGGELLLPPSGFIAGIYARTDTLRGVHKAPSNEVVVGALGFEFEIDHLQQERLNPRGINCLRTLPGRGHLVWGARTISDDPEWTYVNVRRYVLLLERSIERGTEWVAFEPNGEPLWASVTATIEAFLDSQWRNGRLVGMSPKEAFFVRCDRSTMTQDDLDNGRLVCAIGVAVVRPAEFLVFRIGQMTAVAGPSPSDRARRGSDGRDSMATVGQTPYGAFSFVVEFDPGTDRAIRAGFSEVSGLGTEPAATEFRLEDKRLDHGAKIAAPAKARSVTLKRGLIEADHLRAWIVASESGESTRLESVKHDAVISLLDDRRSNVVARWRLRGARLMTWIGPAVGVDRGAAVVAVEELVLSVEAVELQ